MKPVLAFALITIFAAVAATPALAHDPDSCTYVPTGTTQIFPSSVFDSSGTALLHYGNHEKLPDSITELASGKTYPIPNDAWEDTKQLNGVDPQGLAIASVSPERGTVRLTDLRTGKTDEMQLPKALRSASNRSNIREVMVSGKYRKVVIATDRGSYIQDFSDPSQSIFLPGQGPLSDGTPQSAPFTAEGRHIVTTDSHGTHVYDLAHPNRAINKAFTEIGAWGIASVRNGEQLAWSDMDRSIHYINLATGARKDFREPPSRQLTLPYAAFVEGGKKVAIGNPSGQLEIHELSTGAVQKIDVGPFDILKASPNGEHLVLFGDAGLQSIDLKTGKVTRKWRSWNGDDVGSAVLNDGRVTGIQYATENSFLDTFDGTCVPDTVQVQEQPCCSGQCEPKVLSESAWMKDLRAQTLCQGDFDKAAWEKLAPAPKSDSFTEEEAGKLLIRFQKPEGFDVPNDIPALFAILRSSLPEREPDLVLGALQTVSHQSSDLFHEIQTHFPKIDHLQATGAANVCRSPAELESLKQDALRLFSQLKGSYGKAGTFRNWEPLRLYTPVFAQMTPAQKDDLIDQIADSLSGAAAADPALNHVFQSKLYKFSYQAAAPLIGEKTKPLTDLTVIPLGNGSLFPVVLSTSLIDESTTTETPFGFYAKTQPLLTAKVFADPQQNSATVPIEWKTEGGKTFKARVELTRPNPKDKVDTSPAPKYDELWKDNQLTGIVVTGSNLHGDDFGVLDEYLAYFQEKGFHFEDAKKPIPDLPKFIEEGIRSGESDYLIKEAHADGDEKNVFRIYKEAEELVGTLTRPEGKKEVVHLVYPSKGAYDSTLVSNQDFGEWVRGREEAKQGQFVYFNTSCWGIQQAAQQIQATGSKKLLTLAATTTVDTFTNEDDAAEQLLLSAFRDGKSYEGMRKALKGNPGFQRNSSNKFIFPDEAKYKAEIMDRLANTPDAKVTITDPNGNPYNIDQFHH